ncbi:MAG: hypothetical protein HC881_05520 [Leptolyngbyaceae cyanobacterium SL_7_1]|nr:hypothetical protein [Leptolyngbyaceae cyanobacterium SL_7_1]
MTNAVPDWLMGLWQRVSIETADGARDTETEVFYLQTPTCFGDLRIPGDRPDLRQASFPSLTQETALALSQQQGFAGIAQFEQGYCQWFRLIDYQPPQPSRDIGLLYWEHDLLIEEGVDQVYREEWQKIDDGDGDFTALVLVEPDLPPASHWSASLVIAGDYFVYSQNRSVSLPSAESLAACLMHSTDFQEQQAYLSCEISFGRCQTGGVPWEIQRSTVPWREGSALWSPSAWRVDWENRQILQTVQQEQRVWQIREWGTGRAMGVNNR